MKKIFTFASMLFFSSTLYATSLVGYWNFDEGFLDQSINSRLTTASNVGIVSGISGRAAYFNGSSSNLRISGNPISNDGDSKFSVSFWVQPLVGNEVSSILDSRGSGGNGLFAGFSVELKNNGNGFSVVAKADDGQGNYLHCDSCGTTQQFNDWYHIVVTVDTNNMKVFINGLLDSETVGDSLTDVSNELATLVGTSKYIDGVESFYSNQFKGVLDELRLFDNALTASDILALFENTNESVFNTRVGAIKTGEIPGEDYQRNTVYKAPMDGVLTVSFGGSKCGSNYAMIWLGNTSDSLDFLAGRINGYNSASVLLSIGDYFNIDHYRRVSSCKAAISFRPLF